jgi:hypothetical protein
MEYIDAANPNALYVEAAERADVLPDHLANLIGLGEYLGVEAPSPWINAQELKQISAEIDELLVYPHLRSTRPLPAAPRVMLDPRAAEVLLPKLVASALKLEAHMLRLNAKAFDQVHRISEALGSPGTPGESLGELCRRSVPAGLLRLLQRVMADHWRVVRCANCARYVVKFNHHGRKAEREFCLGGRCNSLFHRPKARELRTNLRALAEALTQRKHSPDSEYWQACNDALVNQEKKLPELLKEIYSGRHAPGS